MAFDDAVRRARRVFDQGKALGYNFTLLDVGGGFPGTEKAHNSNNPDIHGFGDSVSFERIAAVLGSAIEEVFPDRAVRVIAEPGRCVARVLEWLSSFSSILPHPSPPACASLLFYNV